MPNLPPSLPNPIHPRNPRLLDEIRTISRLKHYSIRTDEAYSHWIRRFILYHQKRHPRETAEAEVVDFLSHLARDEKVAASTQNQARGHEENTEARVSTVRAEGLDSPHVGASLPKDKKDKQRVALLI